MSTEAGKGQGAESISTRAPGAFLTNPEILPGVALALDLAMFALGWFGLRAALGYGVTLSMAQEIALFCFLLLCYLFASGRAELYSVHAIMNPLRRSDQVLLSMISAFMFALSAIFAFEISPRYSLPWFAAAALSSAAAIIIGRFALRAFLLWMWRRRLIGRRMVVLGMTEQGRRFVERQHTALPFFSTMEGVYSFSKEDECAAADFDVPVRGGFEDLVRDVRTRHIDDIVVAAPWTRGQELANAVETLKELPVNVFLGADLAGFDLSFRPAPGLFSATPMYEVVQRPITGWGKLLKTCEDYVLTTAILVLLSPLLLLVALAVKLDSPGPILFTQRRLGFNNKEFRIYKFRSMYHNRPPEAKTQQATRGDPRVTRVGRIIRATSMDELPQLLNVLDGTMSLVGPRPHAIDHNVEFGSRIRGYFARHKVKPGITGWAQVNGLRGETDTDDKMADRIKFDVYYAENWSLLFDLRILAATAFVVLFQKTAY